MATLPGTPPRDLERRILSRGRKCGLEVDRQFTAGAASYLSLLLRWNERINLTGIASLDEAIDRLVLEPLAAAKHLGCDARRLLDIGSGGGSPAIPLKLARPRLAVWMVESKVRKSAFLRECIRQLALDGCQVETSRLQELLTRVDLLESMDLVSVRAVKTDRRLLSTARAFLSGSGRILVFRTGAMDSEGDVPPDCRVAAVHPLIEPLRSELVVLEAMGQSTRRNGG
jgi:16S rRNA (guanine527-N7)-methyltransferase